MAGKRYKNDLKLSMAYTEGQQAKINGAVIGTNPHATGSEAKTAWDAGWTTGATGADYKGGAMNSSKGYSAPVIMDINKTTAAVAGTATTTVTATVKEGGVLAASVVVAGVSSVPGKATVGATATTNGSGVATFTITGVSAGETTVTLSYGGISQKCVVTVT